MSHNLISPDQLHVAIETGAFPEPIDPAIASRSTLETQVLYAAIGLRREQNNPILDQQGNTVRDVLILHQLAAPAIERLVEERELPVSPLGDPQV